MNAQQKADVVAELKDTLSKVASVVVADYRGLTVEQVNGLRKEIRKSECTYRVVKNTLFRRAIAGTEMEGLTEMFVGPTAIAYSFEDPVAPAKILDKYSESLKKLGLKGGYLEGQVLDETGIKSLAKMPGKDELRAKLLATFQAPAQGFVRLLNAVPQNFAFLLNARERALGGGE